MDPTPNPADHQRITHADEQPPREIKYRRNPKATQPAAVLIVRADEQLGDVYQQIAPVDHQHIAHADEQPPRVIKSTLSPKATEADDALIARADERLRHAYEQIARADEQLAHVAERLSRLEQGDARQSLAVPSPSTSPSRPALRGLIGLVLAACIISGAFVWQSSYGDPAKLMIARWMPQLVSTSSLPLRPRSSADQVIAAEPTSPQSTPSQTAPQELAPKPAPLPPELEQFKTSPEMMALARDNAKAIEQLKTSQEQMARDNAKVIAQLKEQMASLFAKASEQNARPRIPTPPSRPVVTPTR